MSDEIKTQVEVVAEKLAASDAQEVASAPHEIKGDAVKSPVSVQPPRPQATVFQWLLTEVGQMEKDIRTATKANLISTEGAKVVFKECVHMMVETQASEMKRQQEAERIWQESQERKRIREAEMAQFERPQ